MRVLLNGRELAGLDASLQRKLAGSVRGKPLEGVALTPEESIATRAGQLRMMMIAAGVLVALSVALTLGLVLVRAPQAASVAWLIVVAPLVLTLALTFALYTLMLGAHRRRVEARPDAGLASQTVVRVDADGLTVASQTLPWTALSVQELWVRERQGEHQRVTYVDRLALSDGHRPIVLDALFLTNGQGLLEQAWRRLAGQPQ